MPTTVLPDDLRVDVETRWTYHDMRHELRCCDVGIGLGSHDHAVTLGGCQLK